MKEAMAQRMEAAKEAEKAAENNESLSTQSEKKKSPSPKQKPAKAKGGVPSASQQRSEENEFLVSYFTGSQALAFVSKAILMSSLAFSHKQPFVYIKELKNNNKDVKIICFLKLFKFKFKIF